MLCTWPGMRLQSDCSLSHASHHAHSHTYTHPQVINKLRTAGSSKGVSRSAIKAALPEVTAARVNASLKKAIAAGKILQVKDSFKVRFTVMHAVAHTFSDSSPHIPCRLL